MYGNGQIWPFSQGWQGYLDTPGTEQFMYFKNFLNSIHWYDLVPDQSHTFLTAGYSTLSDSGHIGDNDYATGLQTQDGTLGVVYTPTAHTLTIAMSNFVGPVTARWYDPTANTFTNISGSPFPNSGIHDFTTPGNNSAGDPDWVLLLQAALGSPTPTPTATAAFTPTPTPTATATSTPTPTPTPTATPTSTPNPTPTATPTPTPTPIPSPTPTATPTNCIVPNFLGQKINRAQRIWSNAGFTTQVIVQGGRGQRISFQSIPAGTSANCNTTIITVSGR